MKNLQRGFIVPLLVLIIAIFAAGGLYAYVKNGSLSWPGVISKGAQDASATSTEASTEPIQDEVVFTGGDVQIPDCLQTSDIKHSCVLLDVGERCYIPDGIDSPLYTYSRGYGGAAGSFNSYSFKRGSYVWPVNASGVITKDDYDALFPGNQISSSTIIKTGDDVSSYVRTFQIRGDRGNEYLFDSEGKQMASLSNLEKHLIPFSWVGQFGADRDSLETVKRLKADDPAAFADFPNGPYAPVTSQLQKVDIVYECAIENGKVVSKRKIQEVDFFNDGIFSTIQL